MTGASKILKTKTAPVIYKSSFMPFRKFLFVIFFIGCAVNSNAQTDSSIIKMKWLEGSWQGDYKGKPFYEAWRMYNGMLVNFSIEINGNDTLVKDDGAIHVRDGNIMLGKNPTFWKLKRQTSNELMFENDSIKYSNRIIWMHLNNDHWFTILQNPKSTAYYDMVRVPAFDAVVDRYLMKMGKSIK